jgi:hypothetical protein
MEPGMGGTGFGYYEKLKELVIEKGLIYNKCSGPMRIFNL